MKAQEILLLQNDVKPVIRQGYYEDELPKIEKYCKEKNLYFVKSNFKVILTDNTLFSNRGMRVPTSSEKPGMYFVYISKDEQKAWLAAYFELMHNDKDLGITLGYPECCVRFFINTFGNHNPNPEHKPTNPYTNLTQRSKDAVIISHFPCRSDCQQSIQLAKSYCDILLKEDKEHAYQLLDTLNKTG